MDEVVRFNRERWQELSAAGVSFSQPWRDLDHATAAQRLDPEGQLDAFSGKDVLCLAASGGQQSAAFALLGSRVTVLDFSARQLARDEEMAAHYGLSVRTIEGDMQDLSRFADGAFDIVWLAHSINFIPDVKALITQIARVCRPQAMLRLTFTNPYVHGIWDRFQGTGYLVEQPFVDGAEVLYAKPEWKFVDDRGEAHAIKGPKEFRHTLPTILNGLVRSGFEIRGFWDEVGSQRDAKPGSWEHFRTIAPPYLTVWARRRPDRAAVADRPRR